MGESGWSGQDTCLRGMAKLAVFSENPERFLGRVWRPLLFSRSGLIMGEFAQSFNRLFASLEYRVIDLPEERASFVCAIGRIGFSN
jgi:hypothetical protein